MNRQQKEQVIASLQNEFQQSNASFVIGYRGLTVSQLSDLRKKLDAAQGTLQVAKITLIKRAIANKSNEGVGSYLSDQVALVFAKKESPAVAKILSEFAKEHEKFKILGGSYESGLLTKEQVELFARIPAREVLLAQLCGTLKAPLMTLACLLNNVVAGLPRALQEVQKKKSE
jgi:large subunit ribosomal protein L10